MTQITYNDIVRITEHIHRQCRNLNPVINAIDLSQGALEYMMIKALDELKVKHEKSGI